MGVPAFDEALRVLSQDAGADVHAVLAVACEPVPAWDPVVYLADFSHQVLVPLVVGMAEEGVAGTLAGRAFMTGQPVTSQQDGRVRVWVPVVEQTSRTGVLAVTVPDGGAGMLAQAELLGVFAGLVTAMAMRVSDTPRLRRRDRGLSLPAGMQWDMLPPLSAAPAARLSPGCSSPPTISPATRSTTRSTAPILHFAIFDGLGHGIASTLLTGLAVGAYRHARRAGAPVTDMHAAVEAALAGYYDDVPFATGIIALRATGSGRLEWSCAGHPRPLLLRGRKVVAELSSDSVLPFGSVTALPRLASATLSRMTWCCCTPTG